MTPQSKVRDDSKATVPRVRDESGDKSCRTANRLNAPARLRLDNVPSTRRSGRHRRRGARAAQPMVKLSEGRKKSVPTGKATGKQAESLKSRSGQILHED